MLLAAQALRKLARGLEDLAGARVAWEQVRSLLRAAARPAECPLRPAAAGGALVEARGLGYRYPGRAEPVLSGCDLRIDAGDRLLLEGPPGSGKSTLGALLAGLRAPDQGTVRGQPVVAVPQFHENHLLSASLAFNLLMGRRWPPAPSDLADAEATCRELGLDAMPGGMEQMVGEIGWRLSHGERSRVFIARALLQDADLLVLDESFARVDPETVQTALRCVRRRAPTLMVIAHE